jgi:hypothetical protein
MTCCGKNRQQIGALSVPTSGEMDKRDPVRQFTILFEYIGRSAMTVIGPVSGRRYRFEHSGARLPIDPRDRPGLARVPNLRQVADYRK